MSSSTNPLGSRLPTDESNTTSVRRGPLMAKIVLGLSMAVTGPDGALSPFGRRRGDHIFAESSTAMREVNPYLVQEIRNLFDQGAHEFFQDGVESNFSRKLLRILRHYGQQAFQAIAEYLSSTNPQPDVTSEALRWLADYNDKTTFYSRWNILHDSLHSPSPRVRDGAILGFAALDDPHAAKLLREAKTKEQIAELRVLIDQVVNQLERHR
jgi:hypothetical protein